MARITIEDCLERIDNHFTLVLIASRRARQIQEGVAPKISAGNEKPSIIALREIAAGLVDEEIFNEPLVKDETSEKELSELIRHETANKPRSAAFDDDLDESLDITGEVTDLLAEPKDVATVHDAKTDGDGVELDSPGAGDSSAADDVPGEKPDSDKNALADDLADELIHKKPAE